MTRKIANILVPTDFSAAAAAATEYAATLASSLDAGIHLVHVLEEPPFAHAHQFHPALGADRWEERYQEARARLAAVKDALAAEGVRASAEVRTGSATGELLEASVDYGADLIVMGTHGRSGLEHLIIGSIAERLIRTARCPVLAVRDPRVPEERRALEIMEPIGA